MSGTTTTTIEVSAATFNEIVAKLIEKNVTVDVELTAANMAGVEVPALTVLTVREPPQAGVHPAEPYPVKEWLQAPNVDRMKPTMPPGSRELIDGEWALPDGKRVRPIRAV